MFPEVLLDNLIGIKWPKPWIYAKKWLKWPCRDITLLIFHIYIQHTIYTFPIHSPAIHLSTFIHPLYHCPSTSLFISPSTHSFIHSSFVYSGQGSGSKGFPSGPEAYWWWHGAIHNAFLLKGSLSSRQSIWSLCIHSQTFRSIMDFRTTLWPQCGSDLSTWDATITRGQTLLLIFK